VTGTGRRASLASTKVSTDTLVQENRRYACGEIASVHRIRMNRIRATLQSIDPGGVQITALIGERPMSEDINHDRRRLLHTAVTTLAAAELGMVGSAKARPVDWIR